MTILACLGVACGRGVSSNPLPRGNGGSTAKSGGGSSGATGGTVASGGTATGGTSPGSGGTATGGSSGQGGSKPSGDSCRNDGECESNFCTDNVCCEEACDGPCESCDGDGSCTGCPAGSECTDDRCLLANGRECATGDDCSSGNCAPTSDGTKVCCASECDGTCEACGSDGECSDHPANDEDCDAVTCAPSTHCKAYRGSVESSECSRHGQCAKCDPVHTPDRVPCGVGSQCNGNGECIVNGRGRVAAGERHTCIITSSNEAFRNGNVVCWGDNRAGQLGAVFHRERVGRDEAPFVVPDLEINFDDEVWQIAAGAQHTCVLFDYGGVRCWGSLVGLPIGDISMIAGTLDYELVPNRPFIDPLNPEGDVILRDPAVQISAASDGATICALLSTGKVSCWGHNNFGQLGLGHTDPLVLSDLETLPIVELGEPAVEVRSGFAHTCVRTERGRVQCWGVGADGRLGYGDIETRPSPKADDGAYVEVGGSVTDLALGHDHTCAILEGGAVRCWGENNLGQLGYGHTERVGDDETPLQAADPDGPAGREVLGGDVKFGLGIVMEQIVTFAPSRSTCALTGNQAVWCWGQNDVGELGYGHTLPGATENTPESMDVPLGAGRKWGGAVDVGGETLALAEGGRCALRPNGELLCWGPNDYGQMGRPESSNWSLTMTPKEIEPIHWWAQ